MRLPCPICGARDRREFYYQGDAVVLARPAPDADEEMWQDYLHLRENPAGWREELWSHEAGCGAWIVVMRHTTTHEIKTARLAGDAT